MELCSPKVKKIFYTSGGNLQSLKKKFSSHLKMDAGFFAIITVVKNQGNPCKKSLTVRENPCEANATTSYQEN